MFATSKKKKKGWSFRSKSPGKTTLCESSAGTANYLKASNDASANGAAQGTSGQGSGPTQKKGTRDERAGSKILSWLRLWKSGRRPLKLLIRPPVF